MDCWWISSSGLFILNVFGYPNDHWGSPEGFFKNNSYKIHPIPRRSFKDPSRILQELTANQSHVSRISRRSLKDFQPIIDTINPDFTGPFRIKKVNTKCNNFSSVSKLRPTICQLTFHFSSMTSFPALVFFFFFFFFFCSSCCLNIYWNMAT